MSLVRIPLVLLAAFGTGVCGYCGPGLYEDWSFVRRARNTTEPQAAQEIIQRLRSENEQLKATVTEK